MKTHFTVDDEKMKAKFGSGVHFDYSGHIAAGDIDGDDGGLPELVAIRAGSFLAPNNGGTIALENDGTPKWISPHPTGKWKQPGATPSLADLDGDGKVEVIIGSTVLDGKTGALKWQGAAGIGTNSFLGPVSAVADVDGDGKLDVAAGNSLYKHDGTVKWTYTFPPTTKTGCGGGADDDGYNAIGNFDSDPEGEIVIVRCGWVHVLEHTGAAKMIGGLPAIVKIPMVGGGANEGGPPTVADFDGDGRAEIGVAGAQYYSVLDLDCIGGALPAGCHAQGVRWQVENNDASSRVTGSSVFDFDGDGEAEVIYNDETDFRIMKGTTGQVLFQKANTSQTRLEMPIVADVDNDGNAEIVIVTNGTDGGLKIYGDTSDRWVATRRVWNQHAYHVTNVSELGIIPTVEEQNWKKATTSTPSGFMNSWRQNLPDYDALSAPDLSVTITDDCSTPSIEATVCNEGDLLVPPGVDVRFYDKTSPAHGLLPCGQPTVTTVTLKPGECEEVVCSLPTSELGNPSSVVCVDNDGYACAAPGKNNECDEANNSATQDCGFNP